MPFLPSLTRRTIKRFKIDPGNLNAFFSSVESAPLGENWPVVYLLHNENYTVEGPHKKLLYIGESTSASRRMKEHFSFSNKNFAERIKLNEADIVFDETFNKSAILDIEQELIRMFGADSSNYSLQNRNDGQSTQHQYYERDSYYTSLKEIWNELRTPAVGMAKDSFEDVRNSNLFKYSPYTALTSEQVKVCDDILDKLIDSLDKKSKFNAIIEGCAGTGKTVVLIKVLSELVRLSKIPVPSPSTITAAMPAASATFLDDDSSDSVISDYERKEKDNARAARIKAACPSGLKVAYVVPLSELLRPFKTVIKAVCGDPDIVKTASEVANDPDTFDVVFVDEAHRLGTINKFGNDKNSYKQACSRLGLTYKKGMKNPPTELEWLVAKTGIFVFAYDKNQKVRSHPSISNSVFDALVSSKTYSYTYTLKMQMRCKAGNQYVEFLDALFNNSINSSTPLPPWKGYDLRVYDDVDQMVTDINAYNASGKCGLSRVVAGYGWKWNTRNKKRKSIKAMSKSNWDIHIGGHDYFWNVANGNFIFNADRDEIGCVHTVQGFDLNYVGVIFGPEIKYDPIKGFGINKESVFDSGVKTRDKADLLELTIRAYKVMMERGIRGCYVYACNPNLRKYLQEHLPSVAQARANADIKITGCINQLTGLAIESGGRTIKDEIPIRKEDLDDIVDKEDGASCVLTFVVDGDKTYYVQKVTLSADGEYYVFSVSETLPSGEGWDAGYE